MTLTYEVMSFESYPQWRRQDLVREGHKTTWNFLSHIKWRQIIQWTRFMY